MKNRRLRVCMVAYAYYDVDRRIRNYSEALVEEGHAVDVISLAREEDTETYSNLNGVNVYKIQRRRYDEKGPADFLKRIIRFFLKGSYFLLGRHLNGKYDIIHVHNVPDFLVFMAAIPKILGAKVILDIHDALPEFFSRKFGKNPHSISSRLAYLEERASVAFADHLIVANHIWLDKIRKRCHVPGSRSTAILNYPNLNMFDFQEKTADPQGFRIIYPGTISHHHGVDIAIRAMPVVQEKIPKAKLLIYGRSGDAEYYRHLERLIEELNLRNSVRMHSPVSFEELSRIYKTVDVGVVPKRGGGFASEAFSTKIFDFMAAGIPAVVSRTRIDEYYFDESILLFFKPGDHASLARRIIQLYSDPLLRKSLSLRARQFAIENSWDIKRSLYLEIIYSLVDGNVSRLTHDKYRTQ